MLWKRICGFHETRYGRSRLIWNCYRDDNGYRFVYRDGNNYLSDQSIYATFSKLSRMTDAQLLEFAETCAIQCQIMGPGGGD
jgi:hypothetical protein